MLNYRFLLHFSSKSILYIKELRKILYSCFKHAVSNIELYSSWSLCIYSGKIYIGGFFRCNEVFNYQNTTLRCSAER